ncbi:hypothetical protein Tco_1249496 [Tanacetum coccineum]
MYGFKECSSCGAWYNKSRGCSKGGFIDKFVHDPNKTPDSSQRPPIFEKICSKCGDPVEGLYCRQCALIRKKLKEVFQDFQDTSESSNDNPNVVNVPQDPFVLNQDPGENSSQSPPQIDHNCCYKYGDSLDRIFCQRCTCESCGKGAHCGYNCLPKVSIISNPEPWFNQNVDELPQTLPSFHPACYSGNENSFTYDSNLNFVDDSPNPPPQPLTYSYEFCGNDTYYDQAFAYQKIPIYYNDDDDEESSIPLRDMIISVLPPYIAITPVLTTKEPVDSLIMEDEHPDTIPATESDEFINHLVNFSNPLFDINDDCTSSDDESFSKEDVPMDNFKIFSNPLFDLDEEIVSTEIDSLLDEFASELTLLKLIPLRIDDDNLDPEGEIHLVERLLYDNSSPRPLEELNMENSIEFFSPSHIPIEDSDSLMEEIDVFLASDGSIPPGIESDDYDSEGDDNSTSLPELESFHVDYPDSGDSTIDVVEDIPVDMPNILRLVGCFIRITNKLVNETPFRTTI